ncbi:uncharacterized protein LOC106957575 [Poecilia latipinna]|uniref:uncharacterized protein LOC106957575 n=1 Tax=Poecilia latipinna TaxID=48699 RepID=UPI00072E44A6|nr:PREDICTED: uncharacterized protein LOC106957575 [Poecilia latipinna]
MTKRYKLIVIDKVTKPTISCEINNASTSESTGKATLLCSLPTHSDQSSLEFQWSTNGQINRGHMLKISLGGEVDDHQYNCTVKNQLTEESAVFTAKDCYPEPKAQAGLIAGVVVLVVLLLIILLLFFICLKKVRSKKSDLESHSKPGYLNVAASGSEETRVLLDRAPTFPSKQTLEHLKQINDAPLNPPHKDEALMKELRKSIRLRSSSDSEKPYDFPVKQRCKFFEKENGKANEAEPRKVVQEEVLENNPSDSEAMNPELTALSSERIQKATENTNLKVIKKQGLYDPADSGNPDEVSNDQNSGRKKEENEFEKSTPENDVQPPPVAKESSPLSQNSPESAPEAERKQDINPDECAKKSNGESSSSSSEESENEEQAPPASTAKETDSETTVEEQKPL